MPQTRIPLYSVRYSNKSFVNSFPLRRVYSDTAALAAVLSVWPEGRREQDYLMMSATIFGQDGQLLYNLSTADYDPRSQRTDVRVFDLALSEVQWWTIHVRTGLDPHEPTYRAELTSIEKL